MYTSLPYKLKSYLPLIANRAEIPLPAIYAKSRSAWQTPQSRDLRILKEENVSIITVYANCDVVGDRDRRFKGPDKSLSNAEERIISCVPSSGMSQRVILGAYHAPVNATRKCITTLGAEVAESLEQQIPLEFPQWCERRSAGV